MGAYKWLWTFVRRYKWRMAAGFLLVLISSVLNMVNPYMSGKIVDQVIIGKQHNLLIPILAVLIGVTLVKSIIRYTFLYNFEGVSQNVIFNIRELIYTELQRYDFAFYDSTRTGELMARMTGDTDAVRVFIAGTAWMAFENATIFVLAIVMMMSINWKFTLVLLTITPFIAYFARKMTKVVRPTFLDIREQFSKLNSVAQENISGNRVVKAFAKEDYEIEKFQKQNQAFKESNLRSAAVWGKYLPILDSLPGIISVLMILLGGILVINKSLTMGQLVTFNSLIWAINNPLRIAGWLINDAQRFSASAEKIMNLLKTVPKIKSPKNSAKKERISGHVEFKNVNFTYGDEQVLRNINFKARPGQTIAIVGPTGSGKSTLVSLISRFYEATEGEVFIDGVNVKDMNIQELRKSVAVAMQDIFLFSDTIEGNIAYGMPDAPVEQVKQAAAMADAEEFIGSMPEGYDTIIGERGVGLSGGQRQRIALARALLKNPSILILDDTTSSVDMETEHKIQKMLNSFFRDKTTFIIAQRISSVKDADLILVLDQGRIVEQGRHEELLQNRGYYHSVYVDQFGNFDPDRNKEVG